MSKQSLNLTEEWQEIREAFKNHFNSENVEIEDEIIKYCGNREGLKIWKDVEISGSMPLHQNKLTQVEEIVFRDSEIQFKIRCGKLYFQKMNGIDGTRNGWITPNLPERLGS